ncbi:hypothetical protein NECAME_16270, partial [Necator americanus]
QTATHEPIQRIVKEEGRVFPGSSSEPVLAKLAHTEEDEAGAPCNSKSIAPGACAVITTPGAIRNTSVPRTSSLYSLDEDDEKPPAKAHPPDFQI